MITSVHTLLYSDDPAATRAFLKDVLRWPFVSAGAGAGGPGGEEPADWLIFRSGRSEIGVHPTSGERGGEAWSTPRHHELSLMCDDIGVTVTELRARGARFDGDPQDLGFGVGARLQVPGADAVLVYQPRHRVAYGL